MSRCLSILLFLLWVPALSIAEKAFGDMQLLEGYSIKKTYAVDASARTIEREGGPRIEFEAGPNEGSWANPREREQYSWYRERTIHGYRVRFALIKPGITTVWEPSELRNGRPLPPGNILLVTFLLGGEDSDYTANFQCKIANQEELADVLLMVTTFNPRRGGF